MKFKKAEAFIYNKLKTELPAHLYYHSINHVEDVLSAAIRIANNEEIAENDLLLLQIAVLYHDSGFTVQSKNHEQIGCDIAKETLPDFGFTEKEIATICGMIMATKIPQNPTTILEQIICDADLDYLGRDDYWTISNNLYKEITLYSMLSEEDWLKLQINFLQQHQYFTKTAVETRYSKKEEYIKTLINTLANKA